jgi:hypothetical protein
VNRLGVSPWLVASFVLSAAGAAQAKPHCKAPPAPTPAKSSVCIPLPHGKFVVVTVPAVAASVLAKFGATPAGTYTADADGDGYGSTTGATSPCPVAGTVAAGGDCNDASAAINPGAAEVCGNGADDNCHAGVDEGCAACPCFTVDDVAAAHDAWLAAAWNSSTQFCEDYTFTAATYSYDWVRLKWFGTRTADGMIETQSSSFYSVDYDDRTQATFCERYLADQQLDAETGDNINYAEDHYREELTLAQHVQCTALLSGYVAQNGIACIVSTYP